MAQYSADSFVDEFIDKVQSRFRVMKKYGQDEGIKLIPMEKLEKSPRFDDFICNFSIGSVTRKWAALKKNKKSCAEFLATRSLLFGDNAVISPKEERDNIWRKFLCLRYKVLMEIPFEWKKKQAFAFYNKCMVKRAVELYFRKYAEKEPVLYKKYQQKEASSDEKSFQKWISYIYKMKVPEEIKNETKSDVINNMFLHYRQTRTKLEHYDEAIGFTAPLDGYCLRAITDILYKQAKNAGIDDNLPQEDTLPEVFVNELKNNQKTKKHLYRCDKNNGFDDLMSNGLKNGALVFIVDEDGYIGHTMFWSGARDKSGEAEFIGFNSEEEGKKIAKTASGANQDLWVLDLYSFVEQEFAAKQSEAAKRNIIGNIARKNSR